MEYQDRHPTPNYSVTEEGVDLGGYRLTAANEFFFVVYNDHLYYNYVIHIYRGVEDFAVWQIQWQRIRNLSMSWYNVLICCMGICLMNQRGEHWRYYCSHPPPPPGWHPPGQWRQTPWVVRDQYFYGQGWWWG